MKIRHLAVLIVLAPLVAHAANEHANHGNHTATTMQSSEGGFVDGIVKKVDKAGGKVTISHGPLTNLNMPAMTMVFKVSNATWLDQMKTGDKIRFMADNVNGAITVVHFEAAK